MLAFAGCREEGIQRGRIFFFHRWWAAMDDMLAVRRICREFSVKRGLLGPRLLVKAVDGVSLS